MEDLIQQAFMHVEKIGDHVQEGHYDLVGPDGEIILPRVWESVVQPDWAITMHMWPMVDEEKEKEKKKEEKPPPPPAHPPPKEKSSKSGGGGIFGSRNKRTSRNRPLSMPGPPEAPEAPAAVVNVPERSKSKNRRSQSVHPFVAWTSGGMVRKKG